MQQPKYIWTLDKASNCESHRDATRENIIPETEMKKLNGQKRILKHMLKWFLLLCAHISESIFGQWEEMLATFYNTTLVYRFYDNDSLYNDH